MDVVFDDVDDDDEKEEVRTPVKMVASSGHLVDTKRSVSVLFDQKRKSWTESLNNSDDYLVAYRLCRELFFSIKHR